MNNILRRKFIQSVNYAIGAMLVGKPALAQKGFTLHIAHQIHELDNNIWQDIEDSYGIKIRLQYFHDANVIIKNMQENKNDFDIFLINAQSAYNMKQLGYLSEFGVLKFAATNNSNNQSIINYDNGAMRDFFVPMGFYNYFILSQSAIKLTNPSYGYFFNKKPSNQKIIWENNPHLIFRIAFKYMGLSGKFANLDNIKKIQYFLQGNKTDTIISEDVFEKYTNLEASFVLTDSRNLNTINNLKDFQIQYPKEGIIADELVFCLSKNWHHDENIYAFINYLAQPLVNKNFCESLNLATANRDIMRLTNNKYLKNPYIYPAQNPIDPKNPIKIMPNEFHSWEFQQAINEAWQKIIR